MTTPQEYYTKAEAALVVASTIQGEHPAEMPDGAARQYHRALDSARLLVAFAGVGVDVLRLTQDQEAVAQERERKELLGTPPTMDEITEHARNRSELRARGW